MFLSKQWEELLNSYGIIKELTVHDTPQQNGLAERTHQTILRLVRVNLLQAKLPKKLWFEAVKYSCFIHNRTPNKRINYKTPYLIKNKNNYNIDKMQEFGKWVIYRINDT